MTINSPALYIRICYDVWEYRWHDLRNSMAITLESSRALIPEANSKRNTLLYHTTTSIRLLRCELSMHIGVCHPKNFPTSVRKHSGRISFMIWSANWWLREAGFERRHGVGHGTSRQLPPKRRSGRYRLSCLTYMPRRQANQMQWFYVWRLI